MLGFDDIFFLSFAQLSINQDNLLIFSKIRYQSFGANASAFLE